MRVEEGAELITPYLYIAEVIFEKARVGKATVDEIAEAVENTTRGWRDVRSSYDSRLPTSRNAPSTPMARP